MYLFPCKEEGPWDLEAWALPRGKCMLHVSDISPRTHPDDSWAPAPPCLLSNPLPLVPSGLLGSKWSNLNVPLPWVSELLTNEG